VGWKDSRRACFVAEERVGVATALAHPGSSQHKDVLVTVVVEVGMQQVESAGEALEPRLAGALLEPAIPQIAEKAHRVRESDGRRHDIEQAIAVEVVHDRTARELGARHADIRPHVQETPDVVVGAEDVGGDEPLRRHPVGILAQGHVGDIEQPPSGQVVRMAGQQVGEHRAGHQGIVAGAVDAAAPQGQQAGVGVVVAEAVGQFAAPHVAERLAERQVDVVDLEQGHLEGLGHGPHSPDLHQRLFEPVDLEQFSGELESRLEFPLRLRVPLKCPAKHINPAEVEEPILHRIGLPRQLIEQPCHLNRARSPGVGRTAGLPGRGGAWGRVLSGGCGYPDHPSQDHPREDPRKQASGKRTCQPRDEPPSEQTRLSVGQRQNACTGLGICSHGWVSVVWHRKSSRKSDGLSRNDSVGRKGMALRILSQDEARARRGPIEGP
jgi:hypothetical protein